MHNQSRKPLSGGTKTKRTEPIRDVGKLNEFLTYCRKLGEHRNHALVNLGVKQDEQNKAYRNLLL